MSAPLSPLLSAWRSAPLPDLAGSWAVGPGGRAFAVAGLFAQLESPLLVVVPGERDAEEIADDLRLFSDRVFLASAWETLPFEHVSPNISTMARRAEARDALAGGEPALVVASVRSAIQRVSPSSTSPLVVRKGSDLELDALVSHLAGLGYNRTDRVEARGEFAVRGGIVDLFPAQAELPARVDFWGDTVEEIREFSVSTQRSEEQVEEVKAFPAREIRPDRPIRTLASKLVEAAA